MRYMRLIAVMMTVLVIMIPVCFAVSIVPSTVKSTDVSDSGATVVWKTNVLADGRVEYGKDIDNMNSVPETGGAVTDHAVDLAGLSSGTKYYYRAVSEDSTGPASSNYYSFTTRLSKPSGLKAVKTSPNYITISWSTLTGAVHYKVFMDGSYVDQTDDTSYTFSGLVQSKEYSFQVSALDSGGLETEKSDVLKASTVEEALNITFLQVSGISTDSATITWKTSKQTACTLYYDDNTALSLQRQTALGTDHSVTVTSLSPGTRYYYQVKCGSAQSQRDYFLTYESGQALSVSDVHATAITSNTATISWKTNLNATGKVHFSVDDSFSQMITDSQKSTEHNITLTHLDTGMTYYYKVESEGVMSPYSTFKTVDTTTGTGEGFLKLDKTKALTNRSTINVSGTTRTGSRVYIFVNQDSRAQVMSKINGTKFSFPVHLDPNVIYNGKQGNNLVEVMSWDQSGNKAMDSLQVVCDTSQPILILNNIPSTTRNQKVRITGITDPDATLQFFINERGQDKFKPDDSGNFSHDLNLNSDGEYNFSVRATDPAGNTYRISKRILLDRTAPQIQFETDFGKETHFKIFKINGKTDPGARVSVINFGPYSGYCQDTNLQTKYGGCREFIRQGDKYEEFMSTIDPVSYGLGLEIDTTADANGEFSILVGLVENEVNKPSINNLLFNVTDAAGNPYSVRKNIKYSPGCADWSVQQGQVQSFPFNIYASEISDGDVTASAFFPIRYTGTGTPKVTTISIHQDTSNHGLLMKDDDKNSAMYAIGTGAKASQYDTTAGELYVDVPITIKRYGGKVDDLPDKINAYMDVKITYANSQGTATCDIYPLAQFDMQKPELITTWLSPEMINRTIRTLDQMINNTRKAVSFLRTASLVGLVACGAMIAWDYIKGFAGSSNAVDANGCTQAQAGMENTYYICDRILCPNVPPNCKDFSAVKSSSTASDYTKTVNGKTEPSDATAFKTQQDTNQKWIDAYAQYKKQYPTSKTTFTEFVDDQNLQKAYGGKYDTSISAPTSWTMDVPDTNLQYNVYYYQVQGGRIKDPSYNPVVKNGNIEVNIDSKLNNYIRTNCKDGTVEVITTLDNSPATIGKRAAPSTVNEQFVCKPGVSPGQVGAPQKGSFVGCYDEKCPQYDNTKCFGLDNIMPTGGLYASARCVCLPGLMAHLQNWLKIMEGAKKCLQQAQIGEVRGGYCERLLAQFVCDILIELFKLTLTFAQNSNYIGQDTYGQKGFGTDAVTGSLANYKQNSQQISDSLSGRYGDIVKTNMGLSSDQLVNKACVVAFTGDWSLLDSVLNNVVKSVEVEPTLWVEGESRSYGYNPLTGQMNIGYNIYVGILPGGETDIKAWMECDPNYPGGGYCSSNANQYPITQVPSHMSQDTAPFNQNIMFTDNNAKYWYNKVVLTADYKLGGADQHARLVEPITRHGDIAGECTFSVTGGGLSCRGITQMLPQGSVQLYSASQGSKLSPAVARYRQGDPVTAALKINNQYADPFYIIVQPEGDQPKEYRIEGSQDTKTITSTYTVPAGATTPVYMSENVYDIWLGDAGGSGAAATTVSANQAISLNKPLTTSGTFAIALPSTVKSATADIVVQLDNGQSNTITCQVYPNDDTYGVYVDNIFMSPEAMTGDILSKYCNVNEVNGRVSYDSCMNMAASDFRTSDYNRHGANNFYTCIKPDDTFSSFIGNDVKSITSVKISNIAFISTALNNPTSITVNYLGITAPLSTINLAQTSTTATSSYGTTRTVTVNVYSDTNDDGHGDTPISYAGGGTGDQAITFTYEYGTTTDDSRYDFVEPVGSYLNNDGNPVPIGFNVWNPKKMYIEIQSRNNGQNYDCICHVDFTGSSYACVNEPGKDDCHLALNPTRTTVNQPFQSQFIEFLWDNSTLDRQPTTMYDFYVYRKADDPFDKKIRRTFQFDNNKIYTQNDLDICLGTGYCTGGWGIPVQTGLNTLQAYSTVAAPTVTT